jgi:aromatic ring-opening dioxygenase LigB subunit
MPLVFAAIAPHGWPTIPALSDDAEGALQTRRALLELGRRAKAAGTEVVVLATPHGVRVEGAICVADVARGAGILQWAGRQIEMNVPVDAGQTAAIVAGARASGLPVAKAAFAGNDRPQSVVPLDWGTMTPLWFLGHERDRPGYGNANGDPPPDDAGPSAVIVTPSRDLPRQTLVAFGRAVGEAAERDPRRVAFVASCDWAHAHATEGQPGHPAAAAVDGQVLAAVRAGNLLKLLHLDDQAIEDAVIDGLWQALILAGALEVVPMTVELLSYEAPPRYATGMIVAVYAPALQPQSTQHSGLSTA